MVTLPISIEDHLAQAGFCGMEILVLRHLLAGQQCTVRELASKTGKSTGALDQSIKKLLRKKIVVRQLVNGSPKYSIGSLATLSSYLQSYFTNHVSQTKRRADDMNNFLQSLELQHTQPKVEHFVGKQGIQALFERVAQYAQVQKEIHSYMPITAEILQDYATVFDWFNEYKRKNTILQKILTHQTQVSKKYQSTDFVHNRETRFIQPDRCLLYVEHLMAGSAYFCIDYKRATGYMIDYEEFTSEKRAIFLGLWQDAALEPVATNQDTEVNHAFQILSEFFLAPRSIVINSALVCFALAAVVLLQIIANESMSITGPLGPVFDFMGSIFLLLFIRLSVWWQSTLIALFSRFVPRISLASCISISILVLLF